MCPLRYSNDHLGVLITSHALAKEVLTSGSVGMQSLRQAVGDPETLQAVEVGIRDDPEQAGIPLRIDPPQHTRIRRMQTGHFSVRRMTEKRAKIEKVVGDQLDAMERVDPPIDLVTMYALPVASLSLCELLGVPASFRTVFEPLTAEGLDEHATAEATINNFRAFNAWCRSVIEEKRSSPEEDLLSDLIADSGATDDELVGMVGTLFAAGHETTATMLSLSVRVLLLDRSRWDTLRSNPSLITLAVEELLRYLSIFPVAFNRVALGSVEIGDTVVRAGQNLTVSLAAANRDPKVFDSPDELDLGRNASEHLGFGFGRHMCLGQHLARLELRLALEALINRFPRLQLAVSPEDVAFSEDEHVIYGIKELLVEWSEER